MRDVSDAFKAMRDKVSETTWREELGRYGWKKFQDRGPSRIGIVAGRCAASGGGYVEHYPTQQQRPPV